MEVPLLYRQWHDSRLHDVGNGCERLISGRQICGASQKWTLRSLNRPFSRRLDFEKQIALRGKAVSTSKNCKGPGKGVARNWKTLSVIEKAPSRIKFEWRSGGSARKWGVIWRKRLETRRFREKASIFWTLCAGGLASERGRTTSEGGTGCSDRAFPRTQAPAATPLLIVIPSGNCRRFRFGRT